MAAGGPGVTGGASTIPFISPKEGGPGTAATAGTAASTLAIPAKFSNPPKLKYKFDRINRIDWIMYFPVS